jgi:hypothetical protein
MIGATLLLSFALSYSGSEYKCIKWTWDQQDINTRRVICLKWEKKDCSKRLYKEICKAE